MRLIDADNLNFEGQKYSKMQLKAILEFVDAQPTVVEGDFATDTDAGSKGWIPCNERLPEKENVLCSAVSLARNPDTIFVGAYRNGVWFLQSAIATISYPTQYKVIAWMPLPEPWKGE